MKKNDEILEKSESEGFHACGDVGGLAHYQCASLALCT